MEVQENMHELHSLRSQSSLLPPFFFFSLNSHTITKTTCNRCPTLMGVCVCVCVFVFGFITCSALPTVACNLVMACEFNGEKKKVPSY